MKEIRPDLSNTIDMKVTEDYSYNMKDREKALKLMKPNKDLSDDPNHKAFEEAKAEGTFRDLPRGTYVAFVAGNFVGHGSDAHELIQDLYSRGITESIYYKRVNDSEKIHHFRSPRKK